jgi:hypothetical protein
MDVFALSGIPPVLLSLSGAHRPVISGVHVPTLALQGIAALAFFYIPPVPEAPGKDGKCTAMFITPSSVTASIVEMTKIAERVWREVPIGWINTYAEVTAVTVGMLKSMPVGTRYECTLFNLLLDMWRERGPEQCSAQGKSPVEYVSTNSATPDMHRQASIQYIVSMKPHTARLHSCTC